MGKRKRASSEQKDAKLPGRLRSHVPYPREQRRAARPDQYFPAGFVGPGEMAWHGYDPAGPEGTSTEAADSFPHLPEPAFARPYQIRSTSEPVTRLPTAPLQGPLPIYVPADPDRWVADQRHVDELSRVWASYRELWRHFRYMFEDLEVVRHPVMGLNVVARRDLPARRQYPYVGRIVTADPRLEHAFDIGRARLVASSELQQDPARINDPATSDGICQYVNEASEDRQLNIRFSSPGRVPGRRGDLVVAAVLVTTRPIAAGEELRACYNDPGDPDSVFGAGIGVAADGHPLRLLADGSSYPLAPACAGQTPFSLRRQ